MVWKFNTSAKLDEWFCIDDTLTSTLGRVKNPVRPQEAPANKPPALPRRQLAAV